MPSSARLFAYLRYRDAPAALEWLTATGFTVVRRLDGPDGRVTHADLGLGEVVLMVASADDGQPPEAGHSAGDGLYLLVAGSGAVDRWHDAAPAAGGRSVTAPAHTSVVARRPGHARRPGPG